MRALQNASVDVLLTISATHPLPLHQNMSKADYLAKYLDGGSSKKKSKSKSKSKSKPKQSDSGSSSVVVVEDAVAVSSAGALDELEDEDEVLSDDQPVKVELQGTVTAFKGFKRIDGKEMQQADQSSTALAKAEAIPTSHNQQQTVYRDASGRIIDINAKREELQRSKDEEEERIRQRNQQLAETELSKLEEGAFQEKLKAADTFTVSRSNEEYNRRLKQQDRFDDPLSTFTSTGTSTENKSQSKTGKPLYNKGLSPANRFGITAGWFWDGIDRTNGFEELVMRKRNEAKHSKLQVEDYDIDLDEE